VQISCAFENVQIRSNLFNKISTRSTLFKNVQWELLKAPYCSNIAPFFEWGRGIHPIIHFILDRKTPTP